MALNQNLTEEQRVQVWTELMAGWSSSGEAISVNKAELKLVVDLTDQWITDNYTTIYSNFPQNVIENLSGNQLAEILLKTAGKKL